MKINVREVNGKFVGKSLRYKVGNTIVTTIWDWELQV